MTKEEAMQHALGYAAGREDGSEVKTIDPKGDNLGFMRFAEGFARGWDDFNKGHNWYMTNAQVAYDTWQESKGTTIFKRMHQ